MQYNDPAGGTASTVGTQIRTDHFHRKAIIDNKDEVVFTPMASTMEQPKNNGKTMKCFRYFPIIDDRNTATGGLNAAGATISNANLYGDSKNVGDMLAFKPVLTENDAEVNKVKMTRTVVEGNIENLGFFMSYTKDSIDFDSDADLMQHYMREMLNAAIKVSEELLQYDLLQAAEVIRYCGEATSDATITGNTGSTASLVTLKDLTAVTKILNANKTPMQTKLVTGSSLQDTKVIPRSRYAFISPDLSETIRKMKDSDNNNVFIPAEQYADAGNEKYVSARAKEIGAIREIRFFEYEEMKVYAAAGADVTTNGGYRSSDDSGTEKYDVYPILIVGDDSFVALTFQSNAKTQNFKIRHFKPEDIKTKSNPFQKEGLFSIEWWYGFLPKKPERIAVIKTVAEE